MQPPRFQFTIGQLLAVIGFLAVLCSLFTSFPWPIGFAVAITTPGYLLDRKRGHSGLFGSMLAGLIGFTIVGIGLYAYNSSNGNAGAFGPDGPGASVTGFGVWGLFWGTILGLGAWSVLSLHGFLKTLWSRGRVVPHGPGRGGRGLQHARAGGHRP